MRYVTLTKSGSWQFRYQLRSEHRSLFDGRREIKRSLKTSNKELALLMALELEVEIRKVITSLSNSEENLKIQLNTAPRSLRHPEPTLCISPLNALEKFCDYKRSHISEKALNMLKAKCKIVLDLLNKHELRDIRRIDAENVVQLLRLYPTNLKKHKQFNGLSGVEAIQLNKQLGFPTLSEESVRDYCQKLSGFFEWCILNELTDINAFKSIRIRNQRKISEVKQAYIITDLKKIFGTKIHTEAKFQHPYYYWLPLLGYFTGARLNEICQLYKADILRQDGIWVIKIDDRFKGQKLKNSSSRRTIPIHTKLLELGFIEYVQSVQNERIFPELKNTRDGFGSSASKWFGRLKTTLGFCKGHDFHSFRHTFATQLKRQHIPFTVTGEILGHTPNNITYGRYGKELEIVQLQEAVNRIDSAPVAEVLNLKSSRYK